MLEGTSAVSEQRRHPAPDDSINQEATELTAPSTTISRTFIHTSAGFWFVLWLLSSFTFILIMYNSGEQRWHSITSPPPLTRQPAPLHHRFIVNIQEFWGEVWPTAFAIIFTNIDRFVRSPVASVYGFLGWIVSKEIYSAADRFNTSVESFVESFVKLGWSAIFIFLVFVISTLMLRWRELRILELRNHREANQA